MTQALGRGHHLKVGYTGLRSPATNSVFGRSLDTRTLFNPLTSESFLSTHYTGAVSSTLFLEGQVSARQSTFSDVGGSSTDRIEGTQLFDFVRGARYWAPSFCAVCTEEERDSTEIVFKGTSFLPTRTGSHTLVFGYDLFNEKLRHDNHQTASDFLVAGLTSRIVDDVPYPVLISGHPLSQILYLPILESSRGTNFRTHALFVNDTWHANDRLTVNLGVRWDKNDGQDSAGNTVATGSRLSPRFGVVWDPRGDGRWAITGNYAQYAAAISTAVGQSASAAGRAAFFPWIYRGPSINVDPTAPLVPSDEALRTVFSWFDSVGGVNLRPYRSSPNIPGVSTQIDGSLGSPYVVEYGGGVSRTIGSRGAIRADVTYRDYRDFYVGVTDLTTGRATNSEGQTFDLRLIRNSNDFTRQYAGLSLQGSYRVGSRVTLAGNYTLSRLWGNILGESGSAVPIPDGSLSYPEYSDRSWANPVGDLSGDRRHKIRLWGSYEVLATEKGTLTVSGIQTVQSGTPFPVVGNVLVSPFVENPGYFTPPVTRGYNFLPPDAVRQEALAKTDLAVNYRHRFPGAARAELFVQAQVLNVFNQFQLTGFYDNRVSTALNDPSFQTFNPFTTTPVRGTHWDTHPDFGNALNAASYTQPRTLIITFGSRF